MHAYYANSHATIAALFAPDCDGGLFSPRASKHHLFDVQYRNQQYPIYAYKLPDQQSHFETWAGNRYQDEVPPTDYGLLSRAWVYQERLVSPRTVFFGRGQLYWECFEDWEFFEGEAHGMGLRTFPGYENSPKGRYSEFLIDRGSSPNLMTVQDDRWHTVVDGYMSLTLTQAQDKLPAFSAVAQQFFSHRLGDAGGGDDGGSSGGSSSVADEYLCGLRKSELSVDLLWCPLERAPAGDKLCSATCPPTRETAYVAPSWSWASYHGPIDSKPFRHRYGFLLNGAVYVNSSQVRLVRDGLEFSDELGRFGRVRPGGFITIQAPALDCTWEVRKDDGGDFSVDGQLLLAGPPAGQQETTSTTSILLFPDYHQANEYTDVLTEPLAHGAHVAVCLLWTLRRKDSSAGQKRHSGLLVLYRSAKTGRYRRLGCRFRRPGASRFEDSPCSNIFDGHFDQAECRVLDIE